MISNILDLEVHKKMIEYYLDLINENKNPSNLKLLLQEIETLHSIVLKEYINSLSLDFNTTLTDDKQNEPISDDKHTNANIEMSDVDIQINETNNEIQNIKEEDTTDEKKDIDINEVVNDILHENIKLNFEDSQEITLDFGKFSNFEKNTNNIDSLKDDTKTILDSFINNEIENNNNHLDSKLIINNKIDDLSKAFSIADKNFITNKLFNDNTIAFSMAIESINQCATIDQVNIILKELQHKYQWDTQSNEYNYFYSIIQQKFN